MKFRLTIFCLIASMGFLFAQALSLRDPTFVANGSSAAFSLTGLEAHWKLDEASGTRADSHGSNTLADNGTVTAATGKIGDATAHLAVNDEFLSIADNASLSFADEDMTICGWVKFTAATAGSNIFAKWTSGVDREYTLTLLNLGTVKFAFECRKGDNSATVVASSDTFGTPTTGTWYFFCITHDKTNDRIGISIDNGTMDYFAFAGGMRDSNNDFTIGAIDSGANNLTGNVDSLCVFRRLLTADEITHLHNSGNGRDYPF